MGTHFYYDLIIPRESVPRSLSLLAEHTAGCTQASTTVILPHGQRVTVPFAAADPRNRTLLLTDPDASVQFRVPLQVPVDVEIAQSFALYASHTVITEISGQYYRYRSDLSEADLDAMADLEDDTQLRDHGIIVPTGTAAVSLDLRVAASADLDPAYAELHFATGSHRTQQLFGRSPSFRRFFADLVAVTGAVCWVAGTYVDNAVTVHSLHGEAVPGVEVTREVSWTLDELAAAIRSHGVHRDG
ncbi:hypothetical protein ACIA5E_18000 [Nocardia asteroides]|uniref:hypothetical protein n=1 Tax=Nocardia asteroides TaxID=1824 RepID=UPI00379920BD